MLKYNEVDHRQVRFGGIPNFNISTVASSNHYLMAHSYYGNVTGDHLASYICRAEHISPMFDALGNLGYQAATTDRRDVPLLGYIRPEPPPGYSDTVKVAELLENARHFFTDWNFASVSSPVEGQNSVYHSNLVGRVQTGDSYKRLVRDYNSYSGVQFKSLVLVVPSSDPEYVTHGPLTFTPTAPPTHFITSDLGELARTVREGLWDHYYPTHGYMVEYSDFKYSQDGGTATHVSYIANMKMRANGIDDGSPFRVFKKILVSLDCFWAFGSDTIGVGDEYYLPGSPLVNFWVRIRNRPVYFTHLDDPVGQPSYESYQEYVTMHTSAYAYDSGWTPGAVMIITAPSTSGFKEFVGINDSRTTPSYRLTGCDQNFLRFNRFAANMHRQCLAGLFLAAQDGLDTTFSALRSNQIEFASELGEVIGPLQITAGLKWLSRFRGKKKSGIRLILDVLASAKLSYSLGIAPTVDSAREAAKKVKPLLAALDRLDQPFEIRGKFSYQFTEDESQGFSGAYFVARTKILARPVVDTLLTAVIGARNFGVLPSLSAIWDLLPGSFVADWGLQIGDRVSVIDDLIILSAIEVDHSVNSIAITYPFTDEVTSAYGFWGSDGDYLGQSSGYRSYGRFSIRSIVPFVPTRLAIFGEASIPDLGTAGALVYKVLF